MNISKLSKILNKQTFSTILIIVFVSGLLGFIYNILQPNPLPIMFKPKQIEAVDDSLLFNNHNIPLQTTQSNENTDTKIQKPIDTTSKNDKSLIKNEQPKEETKENLPLAQLTQETAIKKPKSVNFEQMKKIVGNSDFIIIDARRPEDFLKDHIPGSINIFALSEPNEKFELIMKIPVGKKYVIYCDGGNCDLSHQLAEEFLHSFGFTNVYIYEGGWEEWSKKSN